MRATICIKIKITMCNMKERNQYLYLVPVLAVVNVDVWNGLDLDRLMLLTIFSLVHIMLIGQREK